MKSSKLFVTTALATLATFNISTALATLATFNIFIESADSRSYRNITYGGSTPNQNEENPGRDITIDLTLWSDGIEDIFPNDEKLGFFPQAIPSFTGSYRIYTQNGLSLDSNPDFVYKDIDLRAELTSLPNSPFFSINYAFEKNGKLLDEFSLDSSVSSLSDNITVDDLINDLTVISENVFDTFHNNLSSIPGSNFDGYYYEFYSVYSEKFERKDQSPVPTPEPLSILSILAMGTLGLSLKRKSIQNISSKN